MKFRYAERKDVPLILQFIRELADYEHMLDQVVATPELLEMWLFDKKKAECAILKLLYISLISSAYLHSPFQNYS